MILVSGIHDMQPLLGLASDMQQKFPPLMGCGAFHPFSCTADFAFCHDLLLQMVSSAETSFCSSRSCQISKNCLELRLPAGVNEMLVKNIVMEASYNVLRERSLVPAAADDQRTTANNSSCEPDEDDCLYGSDADSIIEW